jgi:hypothetical protein
MDTDELQNPNPTVFKKQSIDEHLLHKRHQQECDSTEVDDVDNYESKQL